MLRRKGDGRMSDGGKSNFSGPGGLVRLLIVAVILAGCIGIAMAVAHAAGIAIPAFVITILWIVFAVLVGVLAIKFIASLL